MNQDRDLTWHFCAETLRLEADGMEAESMRYHVGLNMTTGRTECLGCLTASKLQTSMVEKRKTATMTSP